MRVLLTTESYLPYLSGVTVSVDAVARGLGARGHDVLVLAPRPARGRTPRAAGSPGPEPRHAWLRSFQLPVVAPDDYRTPWPFGQARALREARRFAPDIVHAQSPFVSGRLARRLAAELGVPLVFTHHTRFEAYGHYLGPLAGPAHRPIGAYLRRFWAACDAIVAPSTDLADEIRRRLPAAGADRVHVVPTGIDVAGIHALAPVDARPVAGWPPDTIVVASLGRLAPEKSPELLLDGFALAVADVDRLRLLVIGGGPSKPDLRERAAEPDLAGRVYFTGPLERTEALAWLRAANLFVFTSRTETQGLVLAEAMAAGLPAVAVDGPGVRDSVRDGVDGIVVPAPHGGPDARALAGAIAAMADDDRRAEATRRAAGDAGRFDLTWRLDEIEAVYAAVGAPAPSTRLA